VFDYVVTVVAVVAVVAIVAVVALIIVVVVVVAKAIVRASFEHCIPMDYALYYHGLTRNLWFFGDDYCRTQLTDSNVKPHPYYLLAILRPLDSSSHLHLHDLTDSSCAEEIAPALRPQHSSANYF